MGETSYRKAGMYGKTCLVMQMRVEPSWIGDTFTNVNFLYNRNIPPKEFYAVFLGSSKERFT